MKIQLMFEVEVNRVLTELELKDIGKSISSDLQDLEDCEGLFYASTARDPMNHQKIVVTARNI